MCIICVGLDNETLAPWEAARNMREMIEHLDQEHAKELIEKINSLMSISDFCKDCECDPCDCSWGSTND
jgi:hypothetical protein|tara:strand:+ start:425 stop:631 length:207 start_codon:yes stop_codon:yes gene_type:complete